MIMIDVNHVVKYLVCKISYFRSGDDKEKYEYDMETRSSRTLEPLLLIWIIFNTCMGK